MRRSEIANFSGFPASDEQQLLRRESLGKVQQQKLKRLAGDFAAGGERAEPAVHRAVNLAENSIEFVVLIEDVGYERVGIYRSVRLCLELDLHVSLSLLSASRAGDCFVRFAFGFLAFFGFAAVVEFLALPDRQFAFRHSIPEIDLQRHHGHALLLNGDVQFFEFPAVQQQLALPEGIVVSRSPGTVLRYVAVYQPSLASANFGVGFADCSFAFAERLDFGAHQYQSCFELVEQLVVVGSGAVLGDDLVVLLFCLFRPLSWGGYHSCHAQLVASRGKPHISSRSGVGT